MTPERLDRIRFTLQGGFRLHRDTERVIALELLAEVDRLRRGLRGLTAIYEDGGYDALHPWSVVDDLDDMLNPTEGDQL